MKRYPVSSTGSMAFEGLGQLEVSGGTDRVHPSRDPVGQPNTPLPMRADPYHPSLPVQSYLVTTPLVYPKPVTYPGNLSLMSLTLRFSEGLHNLLPQHMAAVLEEQFEGWVRVPTASRDELLDLLARIGAAPDQALRATIIDALDNRAAALQFSEPRSFRVRDLLTLATAVTAYSALGSEALVVVALAGSCFVLMQVFLGVATVANYGVTRIGMALVDRLADKVRPGGTPPP